MIRILGNYYNEIWLIIAIEFIGGITFGLTYWLYNRHRFIVYLVEPYLNTFKVKKKLKIHMSNEEFKWKDKGYFIDFKYAVADMKNKPILYYNYLDSQPMQLLKDMTIEKDAKTYKVAMDGKVMQHLASRRMEKWYTYIIIALVCAMIIVVVYAMYNQNELTNEFARLTSRMINQTIRNKVVVP